jgi:putative ABC transport system permease protein
MGGCAGLGRGEEKVKKHQKRPPRFFLWILSRLSLYEEMFAITRDFEIEYENIAEKSGMAKSIFWLIGSILIASYYYLLLTTKWRTVMFRNYFKIAFRQLIKHKGFSIINVSGLALGMTACLLMLMFVANETSYDNFHPNKDRIFRVITDWGKEGSRMKFAGAMPAIAPTLNEEVPEVEAAARVQHINNAAVMDTENQSIDEANAFYVDPEIFDILNWHLVKGDKQNVLDEPYTVVLSYKIARKYFRTDEALGQSLTINDKPYKITGVMKDLPANTHLYCEILVSYETVHALGLYPEKPWNVWGDTHNYILLKENVPVDAIHKKLNGLLIKNAGDWYRGRMDLIPQPLSAIHWDNESRGDMGPKGNYMYVYLFLSASILVLFIACFNFMNLSTSRYADRMKEVGIRKVVGANRRQLIHQFLVESTLVALMAAAIGIYLFILLNKSLYALLNIDFIIGSSHSIYLYGIIVLLVCVVGLIAGGYPAFFLSRFRPVDIIKSGSWGVGKKLSFRHVLVVCQFSISILLIAGTLVVYQQLNYMKNTDLGFEKKDVLLVAFPWGNEEVKQKYSVLRDELLNNPNVISVSGVYTVPGINSQFQMGARKAGDAREKTVTLQALPADYGYVKSMGIELVKGRDLSKEYALDARESVLLNETALEVLGLENPIGEKLLIPRNQKMTEMTVVGVVKDFHVQSLHNKINPMIIFVEPKMYAMMAIKIIPTSPEETIQSLKETWTSVLPFAGFNYRYMEDAYHNFYRTEEKTGKLIAVFTCLALLVSCLGLFGLASFMTSKRVKEIGIRKVLGATPGGITALLSTQFTKWVIVSNIIAWPTAYYLLSRWLEKFAYKMSLGPAPFLLSGAVALGIAILTVSFLAMKAALANPVESLRYE